VSAWILLGLGYDVLSVASPNLPLLRWLVRRVAVPEAAAAANALLDLRTSAEITREARASLGRIVDLKLVDPGAA
jgi:signal transduction protein with GAF and PtsI domain